MAAGIQVTVALWTLGCGSIGINMYFLSSSLLRWITSHTMPKAAAIFAAFFIIPLMLSYIALLLYLTFKPETPTPNIPVEFILSSSGGSSHRENHGAQIQSPDIQEA